MDTIAKISGTQIRISSAPFSYSHITRVAQRILKSCLLPITAASDSSGSLEQGNHSPKKQHSTLKRLVNALTSTARVSCVTALMSGSAACQTPSNVQESTSSSGNMGSDLNAVGGLPSCGKLFDTPATGYTKVAWLYSPSDGVRSVVFYKPDQGEGAVYVNIVAVSGLVDAIEARRKGYDSFYVPYCNESGVTMGVYSLKKVVKEKV